MIDKVLVFLRDRLNEYVNTRSGLGLPESGEDRVTMINGEEMDPIRFQLGAITLLLINLEEEHILRPADPFRRRASDGSTLGVQPPIRLNLYVLFVAHFGRYEQGLGFLSWILRFFQNHRVSDHHDSPDLPAEIQKLVVELVTLPFSEQNEIWNALRTTYHPSVLYKVSLFVFHDEDGVALPEVADIRPTVQEA